MGNLIEIKIGGKADPTVIRALVGSENTNQMFRYRAIGDTITLEPITHFDDPWGIPTVDPNTPGVEDGLLVCLHNLDQPTLVIDGQVTDPDHRQAKEQTFHALQALLEDTP